MSGGESDHARRRACQELAVELARPEGIRLARRLQMAGLVGAPTPEPAAPARPWPRPISIWEPREVDGERVFVRPDPLPLGDHFAATRELRPKRAELPLRVVLFGESAAAGYLYAPHLTPAQVLAEQLRVAGGADRFEVVDLARTNECLRPLVETVESSLQINPDVLVVFAGNNWNLLETPELSPYVPSVAARQRYALALREGGVEGPVRAADAELARAADGALAAIAGIARAVGIPVVLVVPEVNLADWESRQPVHWLPGDGVARWYAAFERARRRRDAGDWDGAVEAAGEMIALDGGACPTSHRLLARAEIGRGRLAEAARACRAEVDAARYPRLAILGAPQVTTGAQELLRRGAARHGFALVDLPRLFAEHTGSPLPGRRLFLDYCHLTVEGMAVAMAGVAAEVLRLSGMVEGEPSWQSLVAGLPAPRVTPEADATAKLGAALHGAHRLVPVGPKGPILEHWCREALTASPDVEAAMLDLVAVRSAPAPAVLTAAQQRNAASPYRLQLQHGWRWDFLDADVIEAITVVLEGTARGEIERLLLAHHALSPAGVDLTRPPYPWDPLERFYPDVMDFEDLARRATWRSPWPESSFCLISDAGRDVTLELTARLPAIPGADGARHGRMGVSINGIEVGGAGLDERWRRETLRVNRERLRPGLNRVTLAWPLPPPIGEAALAAAIARLEEGLAADLHPVFGEVFALVARPG